MNPRTSIKVARTPKLFERMARTRAGSPPLVSRVGSPGDARTAPLRSSGSDCSASHALATPTSSSRSVTGSRTHRGPDCGLRPMHRAGRWHIRCEGHPPRSDAGCLAPPTTTLPHRLPTAAANRRDPRRADRADMSASRDGGATSTGSAASEGGSWNRRRRPSRFPPMPHPPRARRSNAPVPSCTCARHGSPSRSRRRSARTARARRRARAGASRCRRRRPPCGSPRTCGRTHSRSGRRPRRAP